MKYSIKSRKLGAAITFSRPGSSYIYADINGQAGTLGNQICRGGRLSGSTIIYSGNDQQEFAATCRSWYKSYTKSAWDSVSL